MLAGVVHLTGHDVSGLLQFYHFRMVGQARDMVDGFDRAGRLYSDDTWSIWSRCVSDLVDCRSHPFWRSFAPTEELIEL